jgi:hypothetical protein
MTDRYMDRVRAFSIKRMKETKIKREQRERDVESDFVNDSAFNSVCDCVFSPV